MPDDQPSFKKYLIDLEPVGRRIEIAPGTSLLEAAQNAGVELVAICGGVGVCQSCRVRLVKGDCSPLTIEEESGLTQEELSQGYRLACQTIPLSDCQVDIPPDSLTTPQRLQVEGQELKIELAPPVTACDVTIQPPTLHDLRSDLTRLKDVVSMSSSAMGQQPPELSMEYPLLEHFSETLRHYHWKTRLVLRGAEVVALLPYPETGSLGPSQKRPSPSELFGLAVDVGTTKVAAYLVHLNSGEVAARVGMMNPQIGYGEDVISRIVYANDHEDGRKILQDRLVETLNQMVTDLCIESGANRDQVVEAVVVGNTAMHHLFAGLPVHQLGTSPYVPSVSEPVDIRAQQIGLELARGAYVYLPPNIAGYVGADHVAMLLASGITRSQGCVVALDIGTNTEISLVRNERILSCSCASGPAFEGAHIQDGMRAAPGAIERVKWLEGKLMTFTIGDRPPVGICGSGILDAIASLMHAGALDSKGNLVADHPLVRSSNGKREVLLVPASKTGIGRDIVVNRQDINEIQLAKGAIRAGIEVLMTEAGVTLDGANGSQQLDTLIVAGAFGTYLDIASAVQVGMFPPLPLERFRQIGNAAGAGARQMLISVGERSTAQEIVKRVEYIELTTHPRFTEQFVKAIMLNPGTPLKKGI